MSQPLELTFDAARRGKPPRHLLDLDPAERRAAVVELDEPAFRADQLSRHVLGRFTDDPASWTDVPERSRAPLAAALLPPLVTPVRHVEADGGDDPQDALATARRDLGRERAHAVPPWAARERRAR